MVESEKVHYGKLCDIQFKWGNAQTHNSPNRFLLAIFRSILFSIAKLWLLWISHGCYFWHVFVLCLEFNRLMHRINLTSMRMFIFNRSIEIIECRRCTLNFQLLAAKCMLFWMFMTISDSIVEGVQSIVSLAHSCYGRKRCACFTYKNWYRTRTPLFALVFINIYDFIPCVTINFWNAHKWLVTETLSRSDNFPHSRLVPLQEEEKNCSISQFMNFDSENLVEPIFEVTPIDKRMVSIKQQPLN